ncbi:MAG: hypothetical protein VKK42_03955 [Lyngbya sp.]|nr:hypothetical protein [Lyngbya sp.]
MKKLLYFLSTCYSHLEEIKKMEMNTLSGMWESNNRDLGIVILQTGNTVLVHWKQKNPYWNYAAGTVKDNVVKMSFGGSDQQSGNISPGFDQITWGNGTSWIKKL